MLNRISFHVLYGREVLPRSNCRCEELQSTCDREHSRVLELEAEIAEKQQMLGKSKNQNSLIQKQFVDLQVKFQNYKECFLNQKVCEQPNATESNAIFEINKLKAQLQEKDDTIRYLHAEKDILGLLNVGSSESSFETKALETKITQLKEGHTSLKIQNDGYKNHNPLPAKSVKARRAADYYRNLYVDISWFVDRSTKSVHAKPHQAKCVRQSLWSLGSLTIDSVIARMVPMGYLASFTDE
nr:hypothetical protein [Tanacetum cinerariifolium]